MSGDPSRKISMASEINPEPGERLTGTFDAAVTGSEADRSEETEKTGTDQPAPVLEPPNPQRLAQVREALAARDPSHDMEPS